MGGSHKIVWKQIVAVASALCNDIKGPFGDCFTLSLVAKVGQSGSPPAAHLTVPNGMRR